MTALDAGGKPRLAVSPALFAVTVFASAALVFMVQPMAAKLVLPLLGGSPSVWNTSLVFFQSALLAGYLYADALQRIASARRQAMVHGVALVIAALVLPLRITELLGPPSTDLPALWLLGVLAVSLGLPFAILSATAPLTQAWFARTVGRQTGREPYALYAASNFGSLLALLAYPIVVEPLATLDGQRWGWSAGYVAFALLMGGLALLVARSDEAQLDAPPLERGPAITWRLRLTWLGLAAIPSSLMLGVTTHITLDVASAPFLWVIPLALYLATFIIAFQDRPLIPPGVTLFLHAIALPACLALVPFPTGNYLGQFAINLVTFFLVALLCHQHLVARRPPAGRLTEFYLWMSLGGVLGGSFNAFIAPVVFTAVQEYPLVLVLSALARPWASRVEGPFPIVVLIFAGLAAVAGPLMSETFGLDWKVQAALTFMFTAAFLVRHHTFIFVAVVSMLAISAELAGDRIDVRETWRSFFGVLRRSETVVPEMGGAVKMLAHGTTLHGAQATDPSYRCRPLLYYSPETPIGQVFSSVRARNFEMDVGAVGLGTGTVAAFTRPGDRLTFFEIDPLVVRIATDPENFSYTTECAQGVIDYVVGDARLTLADQPPGRFDLLLIDAFSSDAVPAHLLTVEAVKLYLSKLKPDGVLVLHLSNRNLELNKPAMAVAEAAGGFALIQRHTTSASSPPLWESAEDVVIVTRTREALQPYVENVNWKPADPEGVRPWTDDYTNLAGAMYMKLADRWDWLP